jgi:peptide/nickel transport system substrate-binding protein
MSDQNHEAEFKRDRRRFLRLSAALTAGTLSPALLAACGGAPAPTGDTAATSGPATDATAAAPAAGATAEGATGSAAGGGTLVFAAEAIQGNLEPGSFYSFGDWQAIDLVGRGLVFFDYQAGSEPQPALAESWDLSDDGLVYTFTMKQGLTFHDGTPVTATAVKRSFDRLLNEDDPTRAPNTYAGSEIGGTNVASIEVPDEQTVVITLNEADVAYLKRMSNPNAIILSPAALDEFGPAIGQNLVAAGPFKLERIAANQEVELSAFDGFYGGRPALDRIVIRAIADETTIVSSLEAGETHLTVSAPHSSLEQLRANPNLKVEVGVPWIDIFMSLNANIPPFDDKRVRQAVNYAINRENIRDAVFAGYMEMPVAIIPPPELGHAAELAEFSSYNPEKARALLAEAGQEGAAVEISTVTSLFWPRIGELVQNDLNQAGFNCTFQRYDPGTLSGLYNEGKVAIGLNQRSAFVADPDNKLTPLLYSTSAVAQTQTGNDTYPDAAEFDQMLDDARQELDEAARIAKYRAIQEWLLDRMPYAYIGYIALPVVSQQNVQGVNTAALGTYRTFLETVMIG